MIEVMTARDQIAAAMPERELQRNVVDLARVLRLAVQDHGFRGFSAAGMTDLTIVGPNGVLFVELKRQRGRLTEAQQAWRASILAAGGVHLVWFPIDWLDGTIEATLRRLAGAPSIRGADMRLPQYSDRQ